MHSAAQGEAAGAPNHHSHRHGQSGTAVRGAGSGRGRLFAKTDKAVRFEKGSTGRPKWRRADVEPDRPSADCVVSQAPPKQGRVPESIPAGRTNPETRFPGPFQ